MFQIVFYYYIINFLNYLSVLMEARQIDCIYFVKRFKSAGKIVSKSQVAPRGNDAVLRLARGYVR